MTVPSLGPLVKARKNLKILASNAPSPRGLLANRTQQFDRLHAILDSTDPDAEYPDTLSIGPEDDGILTEESVTFATPGTQYLSRSTRLVSSSSRIQFASQRITTTASTGETCTSTRCSHTVVRDSLPP